MACDLLNKGWTTDEANARLGHTPSSKELDKYINFLAIDRKKPQKKVYDSNILKLTEELEDTREKEKLQSRRYESVKMELEELREKVQELEDYKSTLMEIAKSEKKKLLKAIE